ncbi:hypothetical protein [Planomonospora sp. ID82291]|uniref:hypothetical protein n=1 Tax=Planomonospora sp. ID82291 TaxID=2738136 RepID=UPI0018C37523|nr:hypothetical protein [Planomonospora sp. ID82291]MBG0819121.1 hypothetical protein [Planomonospora sp. ID82291]
MDLSDAGRELAATLAAWSALSPPVGGARYGSLYGLLLDLGRAFVPAGRPGDLPAGGMGFCYANARAAAAPGWSYVEGLALLDAGGTRLPVPHAWVTPDGRTAVDVTWPPGKGTAYLGVVLPAAAWSSRPVWDSSPVLDVHTRPGLLAEGLPVGWC